MKFEKNLLEFSDEELLRLLPQNRKAVFIIIYDRYATELYCYIKQMVLTRTTGNQAADHTQSILIDVFQSLLTESGNPSQFILMDYLFSTAYNKTVNYLKYPTHQKILLYR
jgi:hypothetical protein